MKDKGVIEGVNSQRQVVRNRESPSSAEEAGPSDIRWRARVGAPASGHGRSVHVT